MSRQSGAHWAKLCTHEHRVNSRKRNLSHKITKSTQQYGYKEVCHGPDSKGVQQKVNSKRIQQAFWPYSPLPRRVPSVQRQPRDCERDRR